MQKIALFILTFLIVTPVFAESAPVYDADSLPPFEQDRERDQSNLPPPPSPTTERRAANQDQTVNQENSGFVPMQSDRDDDSSDDAQKASPARAAPVASSPPVTTGSGSIGDRLRKLEQQVANMQSSDKNVKLESVQTQIQTLRSELDQLSHQVQQLQKQQKTATLPTAQKNTDKNAGSTLAANDGDANANADAASKKTTDVKTGPKAAKTKKTTEQDTEDSDTKQKTANAQPNVQEEQEIYQTAYNLIKSKKYTEAITALKDMLKKYPSGQFASNAHYWLGELYGLSGKNDQALAEFAIVVKDYSESPRVAEAQLKVGLIYAAQSKWSNAKTSLKQVVTHYPGTTSARLASEQLKQIKQAGH